jgi:hypothetical protein
VGSGAELSSAAESPYVTMNSNKYGIHGSNRNIAEGNLQQNGSARPGEHVYAEILEIH